MDPSLLFGPIVSAVVPIAALSVLIAGALGPARWRPRRLERVAFVEATAAAMSILPPSLRGGRPAVPSAPEQESVVPK